MISVANRIEFLISLDALKITRDYRFRRRRVRVLFQPAKDILDVDDGVVHERADSNRKTAQTSSC